MLSDGGVGARVDHQVEGHSLPGADRDIAW